MSSGRNPLKRGAVTLCAAIVIGAMATSALGAWPCFTCKKKPCKEAACKAPVAAAAPCETGTCAKGDMSCVPPAAKEGECWARAYVPASFKTVTERHCVKEASERLEVIPAEMKWVEERICSRAACTQLEVIPAEYKWVEKTICVQPGYTGWVMQKAANCTTPDKANPANCVFCLQTTPPVYKTVRTQVMCKPPCTREVCTPAEYQTIRRQVVACPASTRKVCIPAEFEDVQKTVMVCPEAMKWERVVCEAKLSADAVNKIKGSLEAAGYKTGPADGKLGKADYEALAAFRQKAGLGIGELSYELLKQLKVSID